MPDYRNTETRKTAAKAIRNRINNATIENPATSAQLRLMVLENYGLSGKWVNEYVKDLVENNEANIDRTSYNEYYLVWSKTQ